MSPFKTLGIPEHPVILAPLAGVSDHPFRRTCSALGADLTYVEMISATALNYESKRTLDMMKRHESEKILGIQITGKSADETARAVATLDRMPFDTIDINMGCPVTKVVKTGCGSAILKDPERVFATVKLCRGATAKPLSVKIRLGWDLSTINAVTIAQAAESAGADFITVHGRTRACDYSKPVNLTEMAKVRAAIRIPLIGNGNIFSERDAITMRRIARVSGIMVSRGALGDPWIFARIKGELAEVDPDHWFATVMNHLTWQKEEYQDKGFAAVCMRKHLLWYTKGWPGGKSVRDAINQTETLDSAMMLVEKFYRELKSHNDFRYNNPTEQAFHWDPKYEMDRVLDRGVGDDGLEAPNLAIQTNV